MLPVQGLALARCLTLADFDYDLPADRIAHHPVRPRDAARMLHVHDDGLADLTVRDLPSLLRRGRHPGGQRYAGLSRPSCRQRAGRRTIGITLDRPRPDGAWKALARNARRVHPGDTLTIEAPTA